MLKPEIPKTVQRWLDKNTTKVSDVWFDAGGLLHGRHTMWVDLADGWYDSESGCHSIHVELAADFLDKAKYIRRCPCCQQ